MTTLEKVAVIGAGPAGCYIVEQLTKTFEHCRIDVFDQSPFPYGLVRTGVAPDHVKMKNLANYFEKVLSKETVRFFGHVRVGEDISIDRLRQHYQVLFICTGASLDKPLPVPFNNPRLYSGSSLFVKWYNAHLRTQVQWQSFGSNVALLGIGNVAIDIARILLKKREQLSATEIPIKVLDFIESSNIKDLHIFVRRGPAHMACTTHELKELLALEHVAVHIDENDLKLSDADKAILAESNQHKSKYDLLLKSQEKESSHVTKHLHIHFYHQIKAVSESDSGLSLTMERTNVVQKGTSYKAVGRGEFVSYPASFLVSSFGYHGEAIPGLPFDEAKGLVPNDKGRVLLNGEPSGVYVNGWIKRGSQGVIGSNRSDAKETLASFLEDLDKQALVEANQSDFKDILDTKGSLYFSFEDWQRINAIELQRGKAEGKDRKKFKSVDALVDALQKE